MDIDDDLPYEFAGGDLSTWEFCQFPDRYSRDRFERIRERSVVRPRPICWDTLRRLACDERAREWIPEDSPWDRMLDDVGAPVYRHIVVEFLSTFLYQPRASQPPPQDKPEVQFSVLGKLYSYSMDEWAVFTGWYKPDELV